MGSEASDTRCRKDTFNGFIVMTKCLIPNEKRRRLVESINFD